MTRSLYFFGGLLAMALIVFIAGVDLLPARPPGAHSVRQVGPVTPVAPDPVTTAVDDLAGWPMAAGR